MTFPFEHRQRFLARELLSDFSRSRTFEFVDDTYPPVKRSAWQQLDADSYEDAWHRFRKLYGFDRSRALPEPVIHDPRPSITFDLSRLGEPQAHSSAVDLINDTALQSFVDALPDMDHMLVLDWQHPAYRLDPRADLADSTPRDPINGYPTVYPDGDYYAYLTPDMKEGTFGHPWEPSLCVIGQRLIDTLGASLSKWLPVKRESSPC